MALKWLIMLLLKCFMFNSNIWPICEHKDSRHSTTDTLWQTEGVCICVCLFGQRIVYICCPCFICICDFMLWDWYVQHTRSDSVESLRALWMKIWRFKSWNENIQWSQKVCGHLKWLCVIFRSENTFSNPSVKCRDSCKTFISPKSVNSVSLWRL